VESHQVIDPRGGRQRAHLPVRGIDDEVEATAGHGEPAALLEPTEGVVARDRRGLERGLRFLASKRVPSSGEETLHVGPRLGFHPFSNPSPHR
jgi:hypothetical protein